MAVLFRRLMLAVLCLGGVAAQASPWSEVASPTPGPAQAIGKPAAGCLAGAATLPLDGPGFEVIRISRNRYYGLPETVAFVEALGQEARAASLPDFYVGDMSLPRGGPMPNGHDSHQTGLDVDIWFNLDPKPVLPPSAREDVPLPSMLTANARAIDPQRFGRRQVELLRLAASAPTVDRIFVNPVIKRALCRGDAGAVGGGSAWLHKIRPWPGHDEHFHVRLNCPAGDTGCVAQAPVPPGDGCDASLDWWFTPHPPVLPATPRAPVLPAACGRLIAR
jgi:penicillin-insensitive murein DD-endopeptidase